MKFKRYIPFILLIAIACVFLCLLIYVTKIDYQRDEMLFRNSNHTSVITIYADKNMLNDGTLKGYEPVIREEVCFNEFENKWVNIDEIPQRLIDAFLCMEDRNFYQHNGVNIPRTIKALFNQITKREKRFGASTLTQQVVKNISGDNELTIKRKLDEIFRAYSLERNHSKEEILEMYLNIIPMGDRLIGVQSASGEYFGKDVSSLSLAECATIVAITNAPSRYHPIRHPDETKRKRDVVLYTMHECGHISKEEYENALSEPIKTVDASSQNVIPNSWFSEMVIRQVKDDLMSKGMSEQAVSFLLFVFVILTEGFFQHGDRDTCQQQESDPVIPIADEMMQGVTGYPAQQRHKCLEKTEHNGKLRYVRHGDLLLSGTPTQSHDHGINRKSHGNPHHFNQFNH